jgi:carboxyl-terminal processing protease
MLKKFAKTFFLFIFVFFFTMILNTSYHPLQLVSQSFSFSKDWFPFQEITKLERLNKVLYLIQESYVDPERVQFSQMYESSMDLIATTIPKLSIQHNGKKTTISIGKKKKDFPTQVDTMFTLRSNLLESIKFIFDNVQPDHTLSELEEVAISGVLDTLDPHSTFLSEEFYKEMQVGTTGKFGGLGIVIGLRDSKLTVISPIDDTPAFKAGIEPGDHIVKIEDETTTGMTLTEAVEKMRGDQGSAVTITIERKGWVASKDFKIIRDIIRVESVEYALLPNDIGYVKLKNFQEDSTKQMKKALSQLNDKTQNGLKGLVFDLRNNPGGLLDQAIEISDLFLEQGTIVTTVGLKNKMRDSQTAVQKNTQPLYPMVVVVNEGSASASEIVAGALQRNQRAIVLGQKTFGKGTVQTLYDLPQQSALKLTVAKYLTPGDISIQSIGIGPDIQTVPVVIDKDQITFFYSEEEHGEAELERHFSNDAKTKTLIMQPEGSVEYLFTKQTPEEMEKEYSFSRLSFEGKQKRLLEDFEIKTAFNIVHTSTASSKGALLESAKKELLVTSKAQGLQIATAMQKQGIDWTASQNPLTGKCSAPEVSFLVLPQTKEPVIYSGDKIEIQAIMKNTGECTLYQAKATSKSDSGFFDHREVFFGKLAPNQSVIRKIPFTIPKYQPAGLYSMTFAFDENQKIAPKNQDVTFAILPTKQPMFTMEYDLNDAVENQTGFLAPNLPERGEKFYLNVKIKNIGEVISNETFVAIKQDGEKTVQFDKAREKFEKLAPNQEKTVKFLVEVPQKFNEPSFSLLLTTSDMDYQSYIQKKINVKLFQAKVAEPKLEKVVKFFEEPKVSISNLQQLIKMQNGSAIIDGVVKDDVAVQDMYVMVNGKKSVYHPFADDKKSENFHLTVPLKKGKNEVIIVARDDQDLVQTIPLNLISQ